LRLPAATVAVGISQELSVLVRLVVELRFVLFPFGKHPLVCKHELLSVSLIAENVDSPVRLELAVTPPVDEKSWWLLDLVPEALNCIVPPVKLRDD